MTIPQRILLNVAIAAGLVVAVATLVTYRIVYHEATDRDLDHLETYVNERARREELGFQQVQANLALVRGQFLKRMTAGLPRNIDGQWNERFELFPDGAWRSRRQFADGRKYSTLFAHKSVVFTQELRIQTLRAQNICDDLLPGWVDTFPSVYFVLPGWLNIGFDPRIPNWVWDTPADYDPSGMEWFQLALATNRPASGFAWSGVIEEPTTRVPIVSVYLPIEQDGKFFGSVGHDLFVNRLMEETTRSGLPGTMHVIFRSDGRLIAHPDKRSQILRSKGQLRMQDCGDAVLASLYRAVQNRPERRFSGYDAASGLYYSVARLAGPEWFFVTTAPRDLLQQLAFQSAQWVLWSGLASLAIMLAALAVALRRQIARPLAELSRAAKQMRDGDINARARVEHEDELGSLAGVFNEMAARVRERDETLRAERDSLEKRVTERVRTMRLNAEVAIGLNQGGSLAEMLARCCESLVDNLDAAFARVWTLNDRTATLELAASAGLYTHLDGAHSRIPLGQFKIGRIALDRQPHLTNDVQADPRISDHDWARREGMVAFAGYPMLVEERVVGVVAIFARHPLGEDTLQAMAQAADSIALGVQRKTSEAKLHESETRLSAVFNNSPAMQSLLRASDNAIVEVNDTFLSKLGYRREEVIGKSPFQLHAPHAQAELVAFRQKLESQGFVLNHEMRLTARDGRLLTALLSTFPVTLGGVPHFVSAGVDITANKEAEARTFALYESLSAAVVVQDETGFVQVNSATLKLFGADRVEEILGKHPDYFSSQKQPNGEDSVTAARRHMEQAFANGVERFEWLARKLDGTEFPVEVTLTALQLEGRPVLQAVIIDLTERRRAEAELQSALAKERDLSQLKSEFVSLVSHEFRTPLEVILSSADNLRRYHDRLEPAKREQLLQTIHRSVRRMSGMMEEVLVLGRLETDRMTFSPTRLNLPSLCRRICDEINSATNKRCEIELRTDELPEHAHADESLLRHIFGNLLSNAVKYSPEQSIVGFVVRREGEFALAVVTDRGCGIPSGDQKRLFQAFHRGSNVGQTPGTGLGLLIVQRCVELHGGDIDFESAEGLGTTFTVRLPLFNQSMPMT